MECLLYKLTVHNFGNFKVDNQTHSLNIGSITLPHFQDFQVFLLLFLCIELHWILSRMKTLTDAIYWSHRSTISIYIIYLNYNIQYTIHFNIPVIVLLTINFITMWLKKYFIILHFVEKPIKAKKIFFIMHILICISTHIY